MNGHFIVGIKHRSVIIGLVIIILITILISGCRKESNSNSIICNLDDYSLYPRVIEEILPNYTIDYSENRVYSILNNGAIGEAFDTQAVGALETGIAKYWYPHYLATVIIAIDRDQTDLLVTGWNDLIKIQEDVGFFDTPGNAQMITAAMSYGLEGEKYTLIKSMEVLALLHENNHLKMNSFEAPITICYDYQAATLIGHGRNIEIIVPTEGTFTYEKGLLSNEKLEFQANIDEILLKSKFPLLNGQSDLSIYPHEEDYASAVRVSDYKHYAKTTQNVSRLIERKVLGSKKYMSIDNREHLHIALVYIIIVTIWAVSVIRRSMQKGISYAAFFTGIILNGWALVRLIKYQIVGVPALTRYLWYAFYIFQLTLPLVLLWMAWAIDKPENETFPPKWWRIMAILISLLIILVFTNDIHGFVLQLDLSKADWDINYSYGLGYYIILFVCMTNLLVVFFILVIKSIRNPRKEGFILPIVLLFMFGVYNYKYIMRDPFVYETDLTIITGIFTMLMFETCIYSGLIPVNTKYIDLFTRSPLKMQIIDKDGELALASVSSVPLNKDLLNKVLDSSPVPVRQDDSLLFANPIPGGYAIWHEDISKLYQLHREIKESSRMLTEAYAILNEEEKLKRSINEAKVKKQLMEQLETEIAVSIEKLTTMIEDLADTENHSMETTRIALLLCYIKRRCILFFREKEENNMAADQLIIYIDELSEIAKYSGLQIANVNEIKGKLAIRYVTLLYDIFYGVADLAVQVGCPYIIQHLGAQGEFYTMDLLISEDITIFKFEPKLISAITTANGKIVTKDLEDMIGINISLPKGGDIYD